MNRFMFLFRVKKRKIWIRVKLWSKLFLKWMMGTGLEHLWLGNISILDTGVKVAGSRGINSTSAQKNSSLKNNSVANVSRLSTLQLTVQLPKLHLKMERKCLLSKRLPKSKLII